MRAHRLARSLLILSALPAILLVSTVATERQPAGIGAGSGAEGEASSTPYVGATTAPDPIEVEPIPESTLGALSSLGYVEFARIERGDEERRGVEYHEAARAWPGVNIVFPEFGCRSIRFIDNDGQLLHEIDVRMLPRKECYSLEPIEGGYLFLASPSLYRLDESGAVLWSIKGRHVFHHDLGHHGGRTVALDEIRREVTLGAQSGEVIDNRLVVIDDAGDVTDVLSLHDLFWPTLLEIARGRGIQPFGEDAVDRLGMDAPGDFYHANSVQILAQDGPIGAAGDVLISLRTLDLIAVVDLDARAVVWRWGTGVLDHQHHPTLLPDGHLLVFDNGWHRGFTRVIEVDPTRREVVWEYRAPAGETFFTKRRGGAYRLENGNTLITESDRGRVFEVDPRGEIVWDYWMPPNPTGRERHTLFRLRRMDWPDFRARREASADGIVASGA